MVKKLRIGSTIGIIGAGQLGKMLAQSALKMGYKIAMYDPNPTSCGFSVSHHSVVAEFNDRQALLEFVKSVDVLTYEFENVDGELLKELEGVSYLPQGTDLLLNSQDRVLEKIWLNKHGIRTTDFSEITSIEDLMNAIKTIKFPSVLKTTRFGYDGKGQFVLLKQADIDVNIQTIQSLLEEQTLILEAFYDYDFEVSVIVARDLYGHVDIFPFSRNQHVHGVLFSSLVGGNYTTEVIQQIEVVANKIAQEGQLVGVCGIEFFIKDDEVLVNEIAPRPHNSGHYTMEATNVSQFDQHILAVTGRPLIEIRLMEPALMINFLGQHIPGLEKISEQYPNAMIHIYDKGEAKKQRKMGHFTITNPDYTFLEKMIKDSSTLKNWRELY